MPSTATITAFHTFSALAQIKSAEHNTNFGNLRGHSIPINTDTASSSDLTHDLGSTDHRWRNVYGKVVGTTKDTAAAYTVLSTDLFVSGSLTSATTFSLPAASSVTGQLFVFSKSNVAAGAMNLDPASTDQVDDTTVASLVGQFDSLGIISDGTRYRTAFKYIKPVYKAATSSDFDMSTAAYASGEWAALSGNSVSLDPGKWTLEGLAFMSYASSGPSVQRLSTAWSSANGANSSSFPTLITTVAGYPWMIYETGGNMDEIQMPVSRVLVDLAATTTVYLNIQTIHSTVGSGAFLRNYIFATRWS